jgi:P-type E1-E2 ATPase
MNNRSAWVLDYKSKQFIETKWSTLRIGDVVMVKKDTEFPSDILLLYGAKEIIYVDTMNLDGESNLKEKFVFTKNLDFN